MTVDAGAIPLAGGGQHHDVKIVLGASGPRQSAIDNGGSGSAMTPQQASRPGPRFCSIRHGVALGHAASSM
jgi:hypothetical protein